MRNKAMDAKARSGVWTCVESPARTRSSLAVIWSEIVALLKHVALVLIVGVIPFGCSNAPQATDDGTKPTSAANQIPPRNSHPRSATSTADSQEFGGPRDVIIEGRLTVDVMQIAAPPRANELAQRLQLAAREDPEWWLEHVKKAQPGEALPYDSRLGLSETEYNEFLALSKQMSTQKAMEATLVVTAKDEDVYVLDGGQVLADFSGIEVDLKNDFVRTPFGVLAERSEINATANSALGAWDGIQWKLEDSDPNGITGTVAKLAVGKLKGSGRCVIYYDVTKISPDGKTLILHVLSFDPPPGK